jgi:recombination protein RecT
MPVSTEENLVVIRRELQKTVVVEQVQKALSGLERYVSADKLIRVALTAIGNDYKLAQCSPVSVIGSVIQLGQVGLVPDGFLGQAYMIPFWNNRAKCYEANPIIGYRGYGELAVRSGKATSVDAHVVYKGDVFDYEYGANPFLKHKPQMDPQKRGDPIAAYAIVYMKEGPHRFEVMPLDAILKIQQESQGADSEDSPWKKWWEEMARKTPMRKLAKWVPLSPEFQMAAGIDELSELGKRRTVVDAKTGEVFVVPEGVVSESAPTIERPSAVATPTIDAQPVEEKKPEPKPVPKFEPAAKDKPCFCTCCKKGQCECPGKDEVDKCGCPPCKTYQDLLVSSTFGGRTERPTSAGAASSTPAPSAAAPGSGISSPDPAMFEPPKSSTAPLSKEFISARRLPKLWALARATWGKDDYETKVHEILKQRWGITSAKEIPVEIFDQVIEAVGKNLQVKNAK